MFSLDIVDSDQFTDLLPTARLLYYELGVRADDDGFVGNPRKITRFAECFDEDIKILENKGFIYMLDSGVLTIRNWLANNQLRNDRFMKPIIRMKKTCWTLIQTIRLIIYIMILGCQMIYHWLP